MTLEEAIKHAEEVVKQFEEFKKIKAVTYEDYRCAEDHAQLAEWLKELQKYRELFSCPEEAEEVLNMNMV